LQDGDTKHHVVSLNDAIPHSKAGDLVLAMGAGALKILQDQKIVPRGRTVTSQRNHLFPLPSGAHALLTYSAEVIDSDYAFYINLLTDINIAIRYIKTGSIAPKLGDYRYVPNFGEAIEWIKERFKATQKPIPVAMDTETLGLNPYALEGYIITVQITYKKGTADVVYFPNKQACKRFNGDRGLKEQINWLLTSPMVVMRGANFKYDLNWLHVIWGTKECTNFGMDTMLCGSILDENRGNSLKLHAKVYIPALGGYSDSFDQKYDKSRMDLVPKEELVLYAGADTDATYQVAEKEKSALLKDKKLITFYNTILHPAVRAYEQVEQVGWYVNRPYYDFLQEELEIEIDQLQKQMREIIGGRIVGKHLDKHGNLNMGKAALLKDFMFSPMGLHLCPKMWTAGSYDEHRKLKTDKEPSTAYEHLVMFEQEPKATEFIQSLKQYTSATKTYSTYVIGFLKHLRSDGRYHPVHFLFKGEEFERDEHGANTGRISIIEPALQTVPEHTEWAKRLQYAFVAPPGYLIVNSDYKQGELKVIACISNEENMIQSYRKGFDLHAVTAADLAGYVFEDFMKLKTTDTHKYDETRYLAKCINFGLIFLISVPGLQFYAKSVYGIDMTIEEAEERHNAFFKLYPGIRKYHEQQKHLAQMNKCVRSPLGRVRHLPLVNSPLHKFSSKEIRRSVNAPVQSTLSDMSLWATAIMKAKGMTKKAPVFGMVHDNLRRYVPEDSWEKHLQQGAEVMENLPFEQVGWSPQLKFTVDNEVGPNLGEMMEPEKFKEQSH